MTTTQETELALLKERQIQMTSDITEIKADIKEIKAMLSTSFVSRQEFVKNCQDTKDAINLARKSANFKMLTAVLVTSVITSLVVFFFDTIVRIRG